MTPHPRSQGSAKREIKTTGSSKSSSEIPSQESLTFQTTECPDCEGKGKKLSFQFEEETRVDLWCGACNGWGRLIWEECKEHSRDCAKCKKLRCLYPDSNPAFIECKEHKKGFTAKKLPKIGDDWPYLELDKCKVCEGSHDYKTLKVKDVRFEKEKIQLGMDIEPSYSEKIVAVVVLG